VALAAGAGSAAAEPAPQSSTPPWEAPKSNESQGNVAETMVVSPGMAAAAMNSESGAAHESTTLMPAWQPPPAAPASGGIAETAPMDSRNQPMIGTAPGAGRQAELTIETGPDAGHSHRAGDRALRLGRSPDNDIILRDPATSGHHARVERRGDTFWIVDLGSTNGTLVNGEPIQEKELNSGDRVTIGQNAVTFSVIGS
jgi:pSer/pThr/pTyr-binding forkhead associated (FHA) protein